MSELLKDRKSDLDFEFNKAEQNELMCNELQADNERLREALYMAINDDIGWYEIAKQVIKEVKVSND